jgi:diguanylate cyclase (GGDEF)-like protein
MQNKFYNNKYYNHLFGLIILIYLLTVIFWFAKFELKLPFDTSDVFFEGMYLVAAFISLIFIKRLNLKLLHIGWAIFTWGLVIDMLDEFTSEPELYDTIIEGIITITGLILIAYAFYIYYFQQEKMEKELDYMANHDPITGSCNRNYLNTMIKREEKRSRRYNHNIGFMMIDIDHFKEFNDRFGHNVGDKILKSVAIFLNRQLRNIDKVIRYGGDEFLIVLPEAKEDLTKIKERLMKNFNIKGMHEFEVETDFPLSLSIGIALWDPNRKESIDDIINLADKRMYENKAAKNKIND